MTQPHASLRALSAVCSLIAFAMLAACGGGSESPGPAANPTPVVATVTVTAPGGTLAVGQTLAIAAVALDSGGNAVGGASFNWESSDTAVATIAADGVLTALAPGSVNVRARSGTIASNALAVSVLASATASSAGLIDVALAAGEIDADTALAYRVYASFSDPRLPARYRGNDSDVVESDVLEALDQRFDTLPPALAQALSRYLLRPSSVGSWLDPAVVAAAATPSAVSIAAPAGRQRALATSAYRPTCHGVLSNWAAFDPVNAKVRVWYDTTAPGHQAKASFVANEMEAIVWPALINTLGFKEPLDDSSPILGCDGGNGKLDIYIVAGLDARGLAVPQGFAQYEGNTFIMLRAGLADIVMRHTIAHELMHAIHWAHRTSATQSSYGWFRDALANWGAEQAYPGNLSIDEQATCQLRSPHLSLDDRSKGFCRPGADINRDYGAYLPLEFISQSYGTDTVRQILLQTMGVSTALEAMDNVLAAQGGLEKVWPRYAKTLWNQPPVDTRPASFKRWQDQLQEVPVLAVDRPFKSIADLQGRIEDTTTLDARINNMSLRYYHFTFSEEATRSVMFHNRWYDNYKAGQKVSVQALFRVEGSTVWQEEDDWTEYEWIGLCRDKKQQRVAELVIIVASAEFRGTNPVVQAAELPELMRNNIGCWGFAGRITRTYSDDTWSSGQNITTTDAHFDAFASGQYTDRPTGRRRVPISSPGFSTVDWRQLEHYTSDECSYSLDRTGTESSIVVGGSAAGTLIINNFLEAMPDALRADQLTLLGSTSHKYVANGVSTRLFKGSVSGPESCGTEYSSALGSWFATSFKPADAPRIGSDGHLKGRFVGNGPGDNFSDVWEWDLAPVRE